MLLSFLRVIRQFIVAVLTVSSPLSLALIIVFKGIAEILNVVYVK